VEEHSSGAKGNRNRRCRSATIRVDHMELMCKLKCHVRFRQPIGKMDEFGWKEGSWGRLFETLVWAWLLMRGGPYGDKSEPEQGDRG
jgi:hypothetical protein